MDGAPTAAPVAYVNEQAIAQRPATRLRHGIHKLKIYTDGTIRWGMLASFDTGEPSLLNEALQDQNWVTAMNHEYC